MEVCAIRMHYSSRVVVFGWDYCNSGCRLVSSVDGLSVGKNRFNVATCQSPGQEVFVSILFIVYVFNIQLLYFKLFNFNSSNWTTNT